MKGDFVSRDADVAAESEKDERVEDDAESCAISTNQQALLSTSPVSQETTSKPK